MLLKNTGVFSFLAIESYYASLNTHLLLALRNSPSKCDEPLMNYLSLCRVPLKNLDNCLILYGLLELVILH